MVQQARVATTSLDHQARRRVKIKSVKAVTNDTKALMTALFEQALLHMCYFTTDVRFEMF